MRAAREALATEEDDVELVLPLGVSADDANERGGRGGGGANGLGFEELEAAAEEESSSMRNPSASKRARVAGACVVRGGGGSRRRLVPPTPPPDDDEREWPNADGRACHCRAVLAKPSCAMCAFTAASTLREMACAQGTHQSTNEPTPGLIFAGSSTREPIGGWWVESRRVSTKQLAISDHLERDMSWRGTLDTERRPPLAWF